MLSTIGAILVSLQISFTMYTYATITPEIEYLLKQQQQKPIAYQDNPALVAVVDHYNTKGQWAGTFQIDSVIKFKIIKVSETESIAHVKYHYVFVPNNAKGRTDSGNDQRYFMLSTNGDKVVVTKMGPFNSARF